MRLSDLITARQFRNTELWQDVLREVDARYQIVIPLTTATHAGGVTINRGTRDFSDEEMALAVPFARHVILAFDSSNTLLRTEAEKPATPATLEPLERLGLTPRESEVLWWLSQGKRDREISLILGTSIRTVNHHVASVLRKLRVENRLAAISLLHRTCGSQPPPPSTAKHDSSLSGIPHSERANHLL
jgi:DNA-binding CsgD family transcriptional regulator